MSKKTKNAFIVMLSLIIVILITIGTTLIVNRSGAVKASKTVKNGLSAYELAKTYGYEGTVQEWLESLNGKSAYDVAKENGYTGSEKDFSESLKANASANAASIKSAKFSSNGELIMTLSDGSNINLGVAVGKSGSNGKDGANGADGKNGKDGVSISSATVNSDGQLVITFSDGKTVNLDKVVGSNGTNGIGIANSEINQNGELVLTYSNGQTANLG